MTKPSDIRTVLMNSNSWSTEFPDLPNSSPVSIPTGQERSDLINKTNIGSYSDDSFFRLELGLRNVVRQLGASKSEYDEALTELKNGLYQRDPKQQSDNKPIQQPRFRTAQIRHAYRKL